MDSESPALRREVLAVVSIALQSPANRPTDRALRRLGRTPTDDPAADAIRLAMEKPGRLTGSLVVPTSDAEAAAALSALSQQQRLILLLHHGRHWDEARIARALGAHHGAEDIRDAEATVSPELRPRLAWEVDQQLRTIVLGEPPTQLGRLIKGFAALVVGVGVILAFLAFTRASIDRPDLIQLRPGGLVRADSEGELTRLIEEQVSVARVTPDNAILYQFTGGPGVAGGSIWYSPRPGERAGQLVGKTGGALGWVEPEYLPAGLNAAHRYAIAITEDTNTDSSGTTTTAHRVVLIDPDTGTQTEVADLGESSGDGKSSTSGVKPVFASYGGPRVLVWMMDAVGLESLPSDELPDCGRWLLFDLEGTELPTPGPVPACDRTATSLSVPTLNPTGTRLMWLETTGTIASDNPPREGWLSSQSTVLRVLDLENGRRFSAPLNTIDQPTFWAQFTMYSQQTGTLFIDSQEDVAVVSIGIWNPEVSIHNYTTYLVDLVGERIETSATDGPVTFGH